LHNLPEKQRKQIEFIDDLYEKIVVQKNMTSSKKPNPDDDKENYDSQLYPTTEQTVRSSFRDCTPAKDQNTEVCSLYSYNPQP